MKKLIILMAVLFSFSAMATIKVGLVNIQKIIVSIKEGKVINTTLEKSYNAKKKLIKAEEAKIMKMQEKFKKQDAVLSDTAKAKKGAEIAKKMEEVRRRVQQYQTEIRKQESELKKPLLDKLKPVIDEVSKAEKVALTFELSSSPVVYAESKIDLTDKVIKAYDKKYAKK
ncbi:MAG: OmpH family outer membrane protein [Halobacteriovoraceae bacterium]|jgi:outer membrane protein|nr:OmpH family outer membrane protein [Halobacteriovoraceae bacterium]